MKFGCMILGLFVCPPTLGAQERSPMEPVEPVPQVPESRLVRGSVTLFASDVKHRAPRDGELRLAIEGAGTTDTRRVTVEDGRWAYEPAEWHESFSIAAIQLEGRPAFRTQDAGGTWPARPGTVSFEARWIPETRLVVTDRMGTPLQDVQHVVGSADFWRQVELGNSSYDPSGLGWSQPRASPIPLPWREDSAGLGDMVFVGVDPWEARAYSVRAEGYALAQVHVDPKIGGDVHITLARAASLELTLRRTDDLERELEVQLMPKFATTTDWVQWRQVPSEESVAKTIGRLEPGPWVARISWKRPITKSSGAIEYASRTPFELVAGETYPLELVFEDPDAGQLQGVALTGELHVPSAWKVDPQKVEVALSRLQPSSYGGEAFKVEQRLDVRDLESTITTGTWRFDAGRVQPGRWLAYALPFGSAQVFEVPSVGAHVTLAVPEPVDVNLRAHGADRFLCWGPVVAEGHGGTTVHSLSARVDGVYRFRAPLGTVRVQAMGRGQSLRLEAGRSDYSLTFEPLADLKVELFDGDVPIEFPENVSSGWVVDAAGEIHYPYRRSRRGGSAARWLGFEEAGAFQVEVNVPPGYRKPARQHVELAHGEERSVRFQLERDIEPK